MDRSLVPVAAERYWGAKLVILNLCDYSPKTISLESDVKQVTDPKSFKTEVNAPAVRLFPLSKLLLHIELLNTLCCNGMTARLLWRQH